jgi:hypothetical protein
MSILDVDMSILTLAPPGRSARGAYLANQWYGQQEILLRYARLPVDSYLFAKMQIGWQTGKNMGLDGEQGFKEDVKRQKLPFFLWSNEQLALAKEQGMTWGSAIGAPFLYREYEKYAGPKINGAIAFPSHSIPEFEIRAGWREFCIDFVDWTGAQGLSTTVCLHPNDYENAAIRSACLSIDGIALTCCGGLFYNDYLQRFSDLISAHETVVVNKASSPMFFAAALGKPVFCRGLLPTTDPIHPDEPIVDCDREWIARKYPWAITGAVMAEYARTELGADCIVSPTKMRDLIRQAEIADRSTVE